MKFKPRAIATVLARLVKSFPVVVVAGARQVGKSTLIQHTLPEWDAVVFDPAIDVGNARQDPDLFLDNHPAPLVLDEIQYAPELVPALKRRVDRAQAPGQYVLTGSQRWSVMKSASESLAGRAVFIDLEGFSLAEIAESSTTEHWLKRYLDDPRDFVAGLSPRTPRLERARTLYEQLWRGFLPRADALDAERVGDLHRAYIRTYIERDVRLLADVGDWQQFGRFVRLVAALTAQEVNHSQLGRDIGVTYQTAQRWLATLRGTFQWFETPAYHGSTIKRVSSRPKGYFADTGLACSLQMISSPEALGGHPLTGALLETLIAAEIRKWSATMSTLPSLYHWRTHGGAEVDLLLERDGRLYPIEIKLTSRPSSADARGFKALRQTYPTREIAPGLVVCPVDQPQRLDEHSFALPWDSR